MYAKLTTLFTTLLLTGTLAQAEMAGTWNGDLVYSDSDGYSGLCQTHNTFAVENEMLTFHQVLSGNCDWDATVTMKVNGTELWQNDTMVGTFSDSEISFSGYVNENGDEYSASFKMNPDGSAYFWDKTVYFDFDGYSDSLEGNMMRSEDSGDTTTTPILTIKPTPARFRLSK